VFSQSPYYIDDPEELGDMTYVAGDEIILANGTYDTDARIKFVGSGTAENPIIFRAETPGEVIFSGGFQMEIGGNENNTGEYLVVEGFYWLGGYGASKVIQFRNGYYPAHHSTIQNCAMNGLAVHPDDEEDGTSVKHNWIELYGTYNTVINCSFMNKSNAGNMILVELVYNAFAPPYDDDDPDYQTINTGCDLVGHSITNNYFYKYAKTESTLTNAGDSETIRIGTSDYQNVNSGTMVMNNYFVEADGENEIITNKSKNNSYINNTFRRSRGSLVLRHGSDATVEGNYFLGEDIDGTGGIRITDSNHVITNNYIQDCITVIDQSKWNNGITFIGGGDDSVECDDDDSENGYQISENITVSNNSIVNTNAPLFYNVNTVNNNDVEGTVADNLIYFAEEDPNVSNIISGDSPTSYSTIGTTLIYSGNVYTGAALGVTNAGFTEDNGITATAADEIFTFEGATGKGADMGTYLPTTDTMVGDGIGACFLDYLGMSIANPICAIVIGESLIVSNLPTIPAQSDSYDVSVNANVSWTAMSNDSWITIDPSFGTGDATVAVTVTANTETTERTGTVTFTQDAGGDDIVRVLNVTQEGADLTDLYNLINTGLADDPVTIHSFSQQEVDLDAVPPKTNYAANTLDKNNITRWAAQDGAIVSGDYKGDGEYVIYDLNDEYDLDLIQIATDDKPDPYGIQIWVSTTGTNPSDFTMVLPATGDLLITTTIGTFDDFDQYLLTVTARYVKLIAYGRFNSAGSNRASPWNNITEIEFYGTETLSVNDSDLQNNIVLYPVPAKDLVYIKT